MVQKQKSWKSSVYISDSMLKAYMRKKAYIYPLTSVLVLLHFEKMGHFASEHGSPQTLTSLTQVLHSLKDSLYWSSWQASSYLQKRGREKHGWKNVF